VEVDEQRALVESLREQWRILWRTRFDDRVRAEGIASQFYPDLLVDKGQVIIATRDYKPLSFHEILETYFPLPMADVVDPSPSRGGVGKFIREFIRRQGAGRRKRLFPPKPKGGGNQQLKKGGRGWLHIRE